MKRSRKVFSHLHFSSKLSLTLLYNNLFHVLNSKLQESECMEADDSIESECNALQDRPISDADYNARESLGVPLFQVITSKSTS